MIFLISLYLDFLIIGPGALSYAPLDEIAERRVKNDWGLTDNYKAYDVLVAPSDCRLLNRTGWLIVDGKILTIKVADCEQAEHQGQMKERGLLADTNKKELISKQGWLIIR